MIFRSRLFGDFHLQLYPAFPGFRKAAVRPAAAAPEKTAWLTLVVLPRSDWRMLPFRLIVQVTLSNINCTLRVYTHAPHIR